MHRGGDRSGGPSSGGDRSGARFQRGPSRWSGSSGGGLVVARPIATPPAARQMEGAVAVAGGSTLTVVLPTILAAVEGTEAVVALVTTSATRGNVTAAATEAEAVGISKVRSKSMWVSWLLCDY
jgi:hypothetical protein